MNFLELRQQVAANLGRTDKDELVKTWINWAIKQIARQHTFDILGAIQRTSTIVNQMAYELPEDLCVLKLVRCDGKLLHELHQLEFEELQRNTKIQVSGRPYVYTRAVIDPIAESAQTTAPYPAVYINAPVDYTSRKTGSILLFPIPSSIYPLHIYYTRWPRELVADADTPDIPNMDDVIVAGATWYAFSTMQMTDEANMWWAIYRNGLGLAERVDSTRTSWRPGAFKPRRGYISGGDPALDPLVRRS